MAAASVMEVNDAGLADSETPPGRGIDVTQYKLPDAPSTIYYVPNFIGDAEEQAYLVERIQSAPKPKWQVLAHRRLQSWGGIVGKKALLQCNDIPQWLDLVIDDVFAAAGKLLDEKRPNHVLINEYEPGQGIMPHTDGPAYHPVVCTLSVGCHTLLDLYNPVTTNTANGDSVLTDGGPSSPKKVKAIESMSLESRYLGSLLLEEGSLVVITENAYDTLLHGIAERTKDTLNDRVIFNWNECNLSQSNPLPEELTRSTTRYSLTIRHVPKVSTAATNLLFGTKK